jgi:hypothetical protein
MNQWPDSRLRKGIDWEELLSEEKDFLKAALQEVVQEVLEVEMEPILLLKWKSKRQQFYLRTSPD